MSAGPFHGVPAQITPVRPEGVATGAPARVKHGMALAGRHKPVVAPPAFRVGNAAPYDWLYPAGASIGQDPAQALLVEPSKQARSSPPVLIGTITRLPIAVTGGARYYAPDAATVPPPNATAKGCPEHAVAVATSKHNSLFCAPVACAPST